MRILLINGSVHENGATAGVLNYVKNELTRLGDTVDTVHIGSGARHTCLACGGCGGGKGCVMGDIDDLSALAARADGIIVATPTHYAAPCATLCAALTRLCKSRRRELFGKYVATVAVGRRAGVCEAADALYKFFEFTGAVRIGASYPLAVFGTVDDDAEGRGYLYETCQNMHAAYYKDHGDR